MPHNCRSKNSSGTRESGISIVAPRTFLARNGEGSEQYSQIDNSD
jgi:hypothetical protein